MSGTTSLVTVAVRTLGIVLGAWFTQWLVHCDLAHLRERLRRAVPLSVLAYLAALLLANGLATYEWQSLHRALASLEYRGLFPLYYYYIVSKANAARGFVTHAVMYAPIGILFWMRYRSPPRGIVVFLTAVAASGCIEFARWLQPGRQPDVNAVCLAGLSALIAAQWMPTVWDLMANMQIDSVSGHHPITRSPRPMSGELLPQGDVGPS